MFSSQVCHCFMISDSADQRKHYKLWRGMKILWLRNILQQKTGWIGVQGASKIIKWKIFCTINNPACYVRQRARRHVFVGVLSANRIEFRDSKNFSTNISRFFPSIRSSEKYFRHKIVVLVNEMFSACSFKIYWTSSQGCRTGRKEKNFSFLLSSWRMLP